MQGVKAWERERGQGRLFVLGYYYYYYYYSTIYILWAGWEDILRAREERKWEFLEF